MEPVLTAPVPAAERGTTRVSERVVAKLAAQAAWEALRAGPENTRPRTPDARPRATAVVRRPPGPAGTGGLAGVRVEFELGYPCDIAARCRAVRGRIAERLRELAGMETSAIELEITRLHSPHSAGSAGAGRRRVQ
ncbi:hypothetical protein [Streptomyces sp. RFCAC02]|uniref:hypothetical protein n=1 Tax=Streptomyces sp. RFCAC02 TaxID=2499143 RepID=UPI001F1159A6|nr:hypothetical protein [Streptomyces sp. RFCAC02]